ncbi:MAG TPA: LuxR family transcriptional regulator [Phytomonospora sp.]
MHDLPLLIREHIEKATADERGRSAHLLFADGPLRQTIIALTSGSALDEHDAPTAASLQVLYGGVCVTTAEGEETKVSLGQLFPIPQTRHSLRATDDAVVLLTTVTET